MTTEMPIIDAELLALLDILPRQGEWNERDYLWASSISNRLVELVDDHLEIVPRPTQHQQAISTFLFLRLYALMEKIGGEVFYAPLRLRLWSGHFRNPDILLLVSADDPRRANEFWDGADLVVEVAVLINQNAIRWRKCVIMPKRVFLNTGSSIQLSNASAC